jgi:hypothetical protein
MKQSMSKSELKLRVIEEARAMKSYGTPLTMSECKKEAEKVFREEYKII